MAEQIETGPVGPVSPQLARQRVRVELPCPTCVHHGVCTIEEQIEQDVTLIVVGVGRPVRLYLGCSVYSKVRGPRDPEVTDRIVATRARNVKTKAMRTVEPRAKGHYRQYPTKRSHRLDSSKGRE